MYECLKYRIEQTSALITLNRPDQLNALTHQMLGELGHALAASESDRNVTAIIVTGTGRGFCAGMDISTLVTASETGDTNIPALGTRDAQTPGDASMGRDFASGLAYLMTVRKPIIAAINGACAGMGMSLALFCDLRFASETAFFTTSFASRGLVAEHGQSWILPRVIGPSRALDLLWSSRRVDAQEALRIGLVDRTLPPDELLTRALQYIAALNEYSAPASLMLMKRQVYRHMNMSLGEALSETEKLMRESLTRMDANEGAASFVEKRKPRFSRVDLSLGSRK